MKKSLIFLSVFVIPFVVFTVPINDADAAVYRATRFPTSAVGYKANGFFLNYTTALNESMNNWNNNTNVTIRTNSTTANTITLANYKDDFSGRHIAGDTKGQYHYKSTIKINLKRIVELYSGMDQYVAARSTIIHEFGHNFGLADDPYPTVINRSIMNHKRKRLQVNTLQPIDITNVKKYY